MNTVVPRRGLQVPPRQLHRTNDDSDDDDDDDNSSMAEEDPAQQYQPISVDTLRKRKTDALERNNGEQQIAPGAKRRKTSDQLPDFLSDLGPLPASPTRQPPSAPNTNNDVPSENPRPSRRIEDTAESDPSPEDQLPRPPRAHNHANGFKTLPGCWICSMSAIQIPEFDLTLVPGLLTDWIYIQLSMNRWGSIWFDLEQFSEWFCLRAYQNKILLTHLNASGMRRHFLKDLRDQYIEMAWKQVKLSTQSDIIDDLVIYENPRAPPQHRYAASPIYLKNSALVTNTQMRVNATVNVFNKQIGEMATVQEQLEKAKSMTPIQYIIKHARVNHN